MIYFDFLAGIDRLQELQKIFHADGTVFNMDEEDAKIIFHANTKRLEFIGCDLSLVYETAERVKMDRGAQTEVFEKEDI